MRSNFSFRNSSTLSVFHLRMLSSSAMFPLSSKSFSTGSEPRTYLICSPLNSLGLSLLTKAWTWGNLPNFHPQTSRIAPAYSFLVSNCASSWQHPLQSGSSWSRLNCPRRSQELQSKLLEKPNSLQASDENSAPNADTTWSIDAISNRRPNAGPSHPPGPAAIATSFRKSLAPQRTPQLRESTPEPELKQAANGRLPSCLLVCSKGIQQLKGDQISLHFL